MNENGAPSVADIAAVVDNNRGYYPYPMYNGNNGGFGSGFGDGGWAWLIIILALLGGFNGNGFCGRFGGGYSY